MKNRKSNLQLAIVLSLFLLSVIFVGCKEQPAPKQVPVLDSLSEYHLVTLKLNGKEQVLKLRKDIHISLPTFRSFVLNWSGKPLRFEDTLMDVTGEGKPQVVHCSVSMKGDDCFVVHTVAALGKYIWTDTLIIPLDYCNYRWGDDSSYVPLMPYSLFFVGMDYRHFVFEYDKQFAEERSNDIFQRSGSTKDSLYWVRELKQYKGKLICRLDVMDYDTYIWDKRSASFVLLHSP
jgi:hypothetical protein